MANAESDHTNQGMKVNSNIEAIKAWSGNRKDNEKQINIPKKGKRMSRCIIVSSTA